MSNLGHTVMSIVSTHGDARQVLYRFNGFINNLPPINHGFTLLS